MSEPEPAIVALLHSGAKLTPLQAVAAKLWLDNGGADADGSLARGVAAFWAAQAGDDPYWDALSQRMTCDACGERYKLENLAVCPNCFRTACHRHSRVCQCGHNALG